MLKERPCNRFLDLQMNPFWKVSTFSLITYITWNVQDNTEQNCILWTTEQVYFDIFCVL